MHHFIYNILAKLSVKCKWKIIPSVQRSLNLLFQSTLFQMLPLFQKYLKLQIRTNKMVNSVVFHSCPSRLASGINPYFFKLLRVLFISRMFVKFSLTMYVPPCVWKFFPFFGVHIRKCIESMHFYSCLSSPLKTPGTVFWKSVSPMGQEQKGGGNYDLFY